MSKPKFFALVSNADTGRLDIDPLVGQTKAYAVAEALSQNEDGGVTILTRKDLERIRAQIEVLLS